MEVVCEEAVELVELEESFPFSASYSALISAKVFRPLLMREA